MTDSEELRRKVFGPCPVEGCSDSMTHTVDAADAAGTIRVIFACEKHCIEFCQMAKSAKPQDGPPPTKWRMT